MVLIHIGHDVLEESKVELGKVLKGMETCLMEKFGFKMNKGKTKVMKNSRNEAAIL